MMGSISMTEEMMRRAKELAREYPAVLRALERLERLQQALLAYGVEKYVAVEPGMLSSYHYYTGIIFAGYTFGSGEPIVKGGRYDGLLGHFGKDAPAIGFAVVIDQLLAALSRQKVKIPVESDEALVVYPADRQEEAIRRAVAMRKEGRCVSMVRKEDGRDEEDYRAYAKRMRMREVLFL